jgi:hypothetical protein
MTEILKNKLSILLLTIIFSPYIYPAVRLDHILLIILSIYLIFTRLPLICVKIFIFLLLMYITTFFTTFFQLMIGNVLAPISPIMDSFEWYLRGAIIFLFVSGIKNISHNDIILISKTYIFSTIFIGIIAIVQSLEINNFLVDKFLSFYDPGVSYRRDLGSINNRYSSILGQPVSYGIFFLFAISILFFYGDRIIKSRIIRIPVFSFVLATSILSVSKVILIGIPILIVSRVFLALIRHVRLRLEDYLSWSFFLILGYFITSESNIFAAEHLTNSYKKFTSIFDIILFSYDARFGAKAQLATDLNVFKENLIFGIGWSESHKGVHLGDSGYLPILVRSGIVGFFFYVTYLLAIFINSFISLRRNFGPRDPVAMNYLFLFFISTIFALGTPIFYIDRSSDFFWMISAVAISTIKKKLSNEKNME